MKKLLLIVPLLFLVSCGDDKVFIPDYKSQIDDNTNRISQLEKRVDSLESNVASLSEELDSLSSVVDLLGTDLGALESDLEEEIDARGVSDRRLAALIARANAQRRSLAHRFYRFNRYQQNLNRRQSAINTRLFTSVLALDKALTKLGKKLNKRIDNLEISDIAGLSKALKKLRLSITDLGDDVGDLVDDINSTISDLEDDIEELEEHEHEHEHDDDDDDDDDHQGPFCPPGVPFLGCGFPFPVHP